MTTSTSNTYSILFEEGWLRWNEDAWGLTPSIKQYSDSNNRLFIETVIYTDKRNRIRMPPLSFYLPLRISESTSALEPYQRERAWLEAATQLATDLTHLGIVGSLAFPPGIIDARPFKWAGLATNVMFTYVSDIPVPLAPSKSVQKSLRRSIRSEIEVSQTQAFDEVMECLETTGSRKSFTYRLTVDKLRHLHDLLGPSKIYSHVAKNSSGSPVSAGVRLASPYGTVIGWVQGTKQEGLKSGAAQAVQRQVLTDAEIAGATGYDYGGANLRSVAEAKAAWNMKLSPYLVVSDFDMRALYRTFKGVGTRTLRNRRTP